MNTVEECEKSIESSLKICSEEIINLKEIYSNFFEFEHVFSSESGGKTRLNRQYFNEDHEKIQEKIISLNNLLDELLVIIKETLKNELEKQNIFHKSTFINSVYDDSNFFELLEMDLDTAVISKVFIQNLVNNLEKLTVLKNKIFNLKYFIFMFDTSHMNKILNKLGMEDLINSKLIFEIIDTYGLQNEELDKFEYNINHFNNLEEKTKSFISFNDFLELHKRRTDSYTYANVRYKITLDYENEVELKKEVTINKAYVENIVSNFIEQSCMDLVKKELKKGKIQKFIDVSISKKKKRIYISVKNNGFEIKNVHSLYLSDNENKYIIESRNLAKMINGKIEINSLEGEGMEYLLDFKVK